MNQQLYTEADWQRLGASTLNRAKEIPTPQLLRVTPAEALRQLNRDGIDEVVIASKIAEYVDIASKAMDATAAQVAITRTMLTTWHAYRRAAGYSAAVDCLAVCRGVVAQVLRLVEPAIAAFLPWLDECRAHDYDVTEWEATATIARHLRLAIDGGSYPLAALSAHLAREASK